MATVIVQNWEESERGWGVRPEGFTIHATVMQCFAFIDEVYAKHEGPPPDEYTRVSGDPFAVETSLEIFNKLVEVTSTKKIHGVWGKGSYFDKGKTLGPEECQTLLLQEDSP